MTDAELAGYLGIYDDPRWPSAIAKLSPAQRAMYEHMANVEFELKLWMDGLGPKPEGVIVCHEHKRPARL